eukprot:gene24598-10217_t
MDMSGDDDKDSDMDDDDDMAVDGNVKARVTKKGKVSTEFKEKVSSLLVDKGYDQLRSSKMSQEEFLEVLATFNAAGIHFA